MSQLEKCKARKPKGPCHCESDISDFTTKITPIFVCSIHGHDDNPGTDRNKPLISLEKAKEVHAARQTGFPSCQGVVIQSEDLRASVLNFACENRQCKICVSVNRLKFCRACDKSSPIQLQKCRHCQDPFPRETDHHPKVTLLDLKKRLGSMMESLETKVAQEAEVAGVTGKKYFLLELNSTDLQVTITSSQYSSSKCCNPEMIRYLQRLAQCLFVLSADFACLPVCLKNT